MSSLVLFLFIGCMCAYVSAKILSSEERNKVFNKFPIQVVDVKKYNKFCAALVAGFGVVAEITVFCSYLFSGLISILFTLLLIVEAVVVMKIYNKGEAKMLKKR